MLIMEKPCRTRRGESLARSVQTFHAEGIMKVPFAGAACALSLCGGVVTSGWAQQPAPPTATRPGAAVTDAVAVVPTGYVIGAEDVLHIMFWREAEMSAEVVVRPDGKISLPLLKDVQAAGYTPEQLAGVVEAAAAKYIADPDATVIVKEIRSRKVAVLGEVSKQGMVPLTRDMTVLQVIAEVGGLLEYADRGNIVIVRRENGAERRFRFNYSDVIKGKNVQQNILLQPGDTVLVP
jgi:polysaccharide export outer membrane protein